MSSARSAEGQAHVRVESIGGIERTQVDLTPGVNVLTGRNATNRTSLLQAIMAALGSEKASLKADADEGSVELEVGGETYTRRLARRDDAVVTSGDPYLEDAQVADLFAFLLEESEARTGRRPRVRRGRDRLRARRCHPDA